MTLTTWREVVSPDDQYGVLPPLTRRFEQEVHKIGGARVHSWTSEVREQAIVFLHGVGSSHRSWLEVAELIGDQFELHLLDIPGFGLSPEAPGGIKTEALARIVAMYIDRLGKPCAIASHSMGSIIALHLAGSDFKPNNLKGVLTTAGTMISVLDFYRKPLDVLRHHPVTFIAYVSQILGSSLPIPRSIASRMLAKPKVRAKILGRHIRYPSRLSQRTIDGFTASLGGLSKLKAAMNGFGYDYEAVYSKIDLPIVAVNGGSDGLVSLDDLRRFTEVSSAQVDAVALKDVGHWPAAEQLATYAALVYSSCQEIMKHEQTA